MEAGARPSGRLSAKVAGYVNHTPPDFSRSIHQSVFVITFQVVGDAAVENLVGVLQGVVVDQPVQFGAIGDADVIEFLDSFTVDGEHTAVQELDLHAVGVQIEFSAFDLPFHLITSLFVSLSFVRTRCHSRNIKIIRTHSVKE